MQQIVVGPDIPAQVEALCDQAQCGKPATFAYTWEWGETGVCCAEHRFLLQQSAGQISRTVQFSQLMPAVPPPLMRDERTRLKAETYALEAELEDVKSRGLQLYNENETLTRQLQATTVRNRESEARLKDATREVERLRTALEEQDAANAELGDEISRLRTMGKFDTQRASRARALGLTSGVNVVDGDPELPPGGA